MTCELPLDPEPEVYPRVVSSVSNPVVVLVPVGVKVVSVYDAGVVLLPLVLELLPAEKNASSESEVTPSPLLVLDRSLPLPALGGGVTHTSTPSLVPLDIVTGPPSPNTPAPVRPSAPLPNPRPPLARARVIALANSSSKSVSDVVRLSELLLLGAITRGSPGYRYPWFDTAASSVARPWCAEASDGRRRVKLVPVADLEEDPEIDSRSERSGIVCKGGTKVVDREPEPEPEPECPLSKLVIERMVLIEPVGERVTDWSGIVTERSSASLQPTTTMISESPKNINKVPTR